MAYIVFRYGPAQHNFKEYVVYVGESSELDAYLGTSIKPRIMVTVTATASIVTRWLSTMLHRHRQNLYAHNLVVDLGVQWSHPSNRIPNSSTADTLQLCILIFQLTQADMIPENLRSFLQHPHNTFVGFWNAGDRWRLSRSVHCLELYRYPMDLRYKAIGICQEDLSLAKLDEIVEKCLGFQVEQRRETAMSNWGKLNLDLNQIAYASIDAYCSFEMGVAIKAWKNKDDY